MSALFLLLVLVLSAVLVLFVTKQKRLDADQRYPKSIYKYSEDSPTSALLMRVERSMELSEDDLESNRDQLIGSQEVSEELSRLTEKIREL